ncbi:MAG: TonB-dependent receptor plug domain-containing protein, partial [Ferruginibacter sp.]|nr:TonB-dependent receptor plug domain-containing protein [Chitinophagaceae bacterium]
KKLLIILFAGVLILPVSAQQYKGARIKSQEEKLNEEYCTGLFKSAEGTILDVSSSTSAVGYTNILDWLQGRVAGLQIYTSRTGEPIPVIRGTVPGIYIDEIPVSLNNLGILNINDIAIIKVIKNPFYGGFNGSGGAIAIYTLGGEEEEEGSGSK